MICLFSVILSFNAHSSKPFDEYSPSYRAKWVKNNLSKRYAECEKLFSMASDVHKKLEIAPLSECEKLWVIAVAIKESGLNNNVISRAKAKSSMQTYRKYAPKGCKTKKCDLRYAGIYHAVSLYRKYGMCSGAAKYNAGPKGKCGGISTKYAEKVMNIYFQLWEFEWLECLPDGDKGC